MPPPPLTSESSAPTDTRWFLEQVRPHEPALRAYLRERFPMLRDVDDLVQESYARLLREPGARRVEHAKAYLFAVARNVALDLLRRSQIITLESLSTVERLPLVEEAPDAAEKATRRQELELLQQAIATLPQRCREVLLLRKLHGLSHREIAQRLGIAESTVNNQLTLGVLRCREFFRARGAMQDGT